MTSLDLTRNVALERFEFSTTMTNLSLAHGWIYLTLRSITSPVFNEFVIWILNSRYPVTPMNAGSWRAVDTLLISMAERNPGLRVELVGYGDWSFITSYLPLATSTGLITFGSPVGEENRFLKLGVL